MSSIYSITYSYTCFFTAAQHHNRDHVMIEDVQRSTFSPDSDVKGCTAPPRELAGPHLSIHIVLIPFKTASWSRYKYTATPYMRVIRVCPFKFRLVVS